jgi:hypothetical protein
MAKVKATSSSSSSVKMRPALTPEAREDQMVHLAVNLAEQQLMDGTASSQIITHYLKLATVNAQLEREKLKYENELTKAKIEAIQSQKASEELYKKALDAMRNYSGHGEPDEY